jgi:hypothetical protein
MIPKTDHVVALVVLVALVYLGRMTLFDLDRERASLAARHPGWRVWYVPKTTGGVDWCAQREPTLNESSPAEPEKAIAEIEGEDKLLGQLRP